MMSYPVMSLLSCDDEMQFIPMPTKALALRVVVVLAGVFLGGGYHCLAKLQAVFIEPVGGLGSVRRLLCRAETVLTAWNLSGLGLEQSLTGSISTHVSVIGERLRGSQE